VEFEWNEHKAATNRVKHRISFETATAVFNDPDEITEPSPQVHSEPRFQIIGRWYPVWLFSWCSPTEVRSRLAEIVLFRPARPRVRKGNATMSSKENEGRTVRYASTPLTPEQVAELQALAAMPDEEIDFSDIPEAGEAFFRNARRGVTYRALKRQLTIRLDADVLDWFKRHAKGGKGYQTDINRVLRDYVEAEEKKAG